MTGPINAAPYQQRRTWLIGIREMAGWQLKVYGICADGRELKTPTIEAAIKYVASNVNWPDREAGYGFMTLHLGEQAVWLLVDLWVDDILRHFLYQAPLGRPQHFADGPAEGTMACVWELAVMTHEHASWIEHVLSRPEDPDYQQYLRDAIEITNASTMKVFN